MGAGAGGGRPPSVVGEGLGFSGLAGLFAGIAAVVALDPPIWVSFWLVFFATAAPMLFLEARRSGLPLRINFRRRKVFWSTGAQRLAGVLMIALALAFALGMLVPSLWEKYRSGFIVVALWIPLLAPIAVFLLFTKAPGANPVDDPLLYLGGLRLTSALYPKNKGWSEAFRQIALKGFFIPYMFFACVLDLSLLQYYGRRIAIDPAAAFLFLHFLFFSIDVFFGLLGYLFTPKRLGLEIRSTNDSWFAWGVCLVCYPPFFAWFGFQYTTEPNWDTWLTGEPVIFALWGCAILICELVLAWSTVIFGLRFSNLTDRGIITAGPYRFFKHPCYLMKNLSWWLTFVPFLPFNGWGDAALSTSQLMFVGLIYYARAKTEERHLRSNPAYPEYERWIAENGLLERLGARVADMMPRRARPGLGQISPTERG